MERNTKGGDGVLETLEERIRREGTGAELPEGVLRLPHIVLVGTVHKISFSIT